MGEEAGKWWGGRGLEGLEVKPTYHFPPQMRRVGSHSCRGKLGISAQRESDR